ncbi:MAG: class I SAM-dependent rRNA methyltransferase [Planctomycetota bacterium]
MSRPDTRPPFAKPPLAAGHLTDRGLDPPEKLPTITVGRPSRHPSIFKSRLAHTDPAAGHGDLVRLVLKDGEPFGFGIYNPRAEIAVRRLTTGTDVPDSRWWRSKLEEAVSLRTTLLGLGDTDAIRLVHGEGDGLPGLVVDKYANVLVAEVFSLGLWQRRRSVLELLAEMTGAEHLVARPGPRTEAQEGFVAEADVTDGCPHDLKIAEHGVRYAIDPAGGHKTGFFCDQRDNRALVGRHAAGRDVLDLCCYTGGFALNAAAGGAKSVTAVDLDEHAVAAAKQNAKLNRRPGLKVVHADAFNYLRDVLAAEKRYGLIVLDPPKLIGSQHESESGKRTYADLNRLAMKLLAPGGLLLTCSCSGLLSPDEFKTIVARSVPGDRTARVLAVHGAAPDHPVATDTPETHYLKAIWMSFSS